MSYQVNRKIKTWGENPSISAIMVNKVTVVELHR